MTIKSLNTKSTPRSWLRSQRALQLGLVSALAIGVAAGCSDDDDDDDPGAGGSGGGTMAGGAGGMGGGTMAGGAGGMGGGMMAGGAGGMGGGMMANAGAGGMDMGPTGVAYPSGWQDWPVIGFAHREADRMDTSLRIVVGNQIAVDAARAADGKVAEWPEGSILVDAIWGGPGVNPNFASEDVLAPQTFGAIIVMEKDASYSATGGWGYAQWLGADQDPQTNTETLQNCYDCHNDNVAADDYVFTTPAPIGAPTGTSGDGLEPPTGAGNWKLISVHRRQPGGTPGQIRLVVGNDIAVADARANGNMVGNVAAWSEGAQLLDRVFTARPLPEPFANIAVPNTLATNAYMVKDSTNFGGAQNNWGYGNWAGGDNAVDAAGVTDCRTCHETNVPDNDYIFTQPAPLPPGL